MPELATFANFFLILLCSQLAPKSEKLRTLMPRLCHHSAETSRRYYQDTVNADDVAQAYKAVRLAQTAQEVRTKISYTKYILKNYLECLFLKRVKHLSSDKHLAAVVEDK